VYNTTPVRPVLEHHWNWLQKSAQPQNQP